MRLSLKVSAVIILLTAASCSKSNAVDIDNGPSGNNDTPLPTCEPEAPPSSTGPTLLRVGRLDGTCVWMDRTEVTRAQYAAFLDTTASSPPDNANVDACKGNNDSFDPDGVALEPSDLPVTGVDWCDAAAYCAWAGKSLCGSYQADERTVSELEVVCTDGDHAGFDYNALTDPGTCNGGGADALSPVASVEGCIVPSLVFDLVGNAAEWVDECDGDAFDKGCLVRGGSFEDEGPAWGCKAKRTLPRTHTSDSIGFRCCGEA